MLRFVFSEDAVADLETISDYLWERNADAAARVISSIVTAIKRACLFPESAPAVDEPGAVPGTRKLIEADYGCVIYYRVVDGVMLVVRVFPGSQRR
jgi:plasmid stabilization system protein ParE